MVAVWGGTETCIIKAVQLMQNRAARSITKLGWFTPIKTLLDQCNWLSINQLIFYHTAIQVWKVKASECPVYINSKYNPSSTRSSIQGTLLVPVVEKSTSSKSFIVRSASKWNHLPQDMRNSKDLSNLKSNIEKKVLALNMLENKSIYLSIPVFKSNSTFNSFKSQYELYWVIKIFRCYFSSTNDVSCPSFDRHPSD